MTSDATPSARLPPRLVLFAGLGIDGGVFARQRDLPVRLETPTYPDPRPEETLREYGARVAEGIPPPVPGETLYLGGLSFGAAVAIEAAWVMRPRPRGVFVMSAGFSGRAISPLLAPVLNGVRFLTPRQLKLSLRLTPLMLRVVGPMDRRERDLMLGLVPRVNAKLGIWGGPAILRWEFPGGRAALEQAGIRVHHIHGGIDRITPIERVRPDLVVPRAGHAVNVTHAQEVNRFIMACLHAQAVVSS